MDGGLQGGEGPGQGGHLVQHGEEEEQSNISKRHERFFCTNL